MKWRFKSSPGYTLFVIPLVIILTLLTKIILLFGCGLMRVLYDDIMKILLPIFSGVLAGVAGNLANPHISNIGLFAVMSIGVMSIYTLQHKVVNL